MLRIQSLFADDRPGQNEGSPQLLLLNKPGSIGTTFPLGGIVIDHPGEVGLPDVLAVKDRLPDIRPAEVGPFDVYATEVGPIEVGLFQVRSA
jgi:hypothetical protein